jgi:hypothetical protein
VRRPLLEPLPFSIGYGCCSRLMFYSAHVASIRALTRPQVPFVGLRKTTYVPLIAPQPESQAAVPASFSEWLALISAAFVRLV